MSMKAFVIVALVVLALVAAAIVLHAPGASAELRRALHGSR
jgi:hypothetical protein